MSNNIIYIGGTDNPNKFHVGMTSNNRPPEVRWKDDDYRGKLPYVPTKVAAYSSGELRDEPIHKYILKDEAVTSVKDEEGIRSDEIFRVDVEDPASYLINLVEEAIRFHKTGVRPLDKFFSPRPHQGWVNQEILKRFDGTDTIIQPLNLCARFGKTLQALSLFKDSGLKVMVVAGYWLSANQTFVDAVDERYDITCDVTVIKPDYEQFKNAIALGQRVLIDVSLHTEAEKVDPDLIDALAEYQKLIYIDEADFGAWTPACRATANQFIDAGTNLVCVATGTNIDRALIGTKGHLEPPLSVSYLDLIEAKRGKGFLFEPGGYCADDPQMWSDRLSDIVDVACLNLDAGQDLIDDLNDLTDEQRPNMAKIFAKRNTHIQRQIIKNLLADEDFGADVFGLYATEYGSIEHPAVMMFIPGTKGDINNIVKIGRSMVPHYNWIALHGDDHTNRTAERAVKNVIRDGGCERTVIVSCSMGARSFSVPNIIGVVNCRDGGSVGAAVQQASRCFTPGCDKTAGLVVNYSFNTHRTSSFETDLISSAIQYDGLDTDAAIRRVHGLMNFYSKDEHGYMVRLSEVDFLEYVTSKENLENMATAQIDMQGLLSQIDLVTLLEGVKAHSATDKEWKGIIDKATTYIQTEGKEKAEPDPDKKAIRDLIRKIQTVVGCSANTYYMAPNSKSFKDCLREIASNPDKSAEYANLVGVDPSVVLDCIYQFLPTNFMDMIVLKADQFDSDDNFTSSTNKHSTANLFDL